MIVYGKNAITELFRNSPHQIKKLSVSGNFDISAHPVVKEGLNKFHIKVLRLSKDAITELCGTPNHQGVAAEIPDFSYSSLQQILAEAQHRREYPFILILDHVEDPQNLGAAIRTADFLGVHGVVIPADRACGVTPAVVKVSSGACATAKVARETNLGRAIDFFKKKNGIWIAGACVDSPDTVFKYDFSSIPIAVVIGNESKGISAKIRRKCDFLLSVPQGGKVKSLNASVAAGIFLYEIYKQRSISQANS